MSKMPYPWDENPGLAPVLRDPAIWAAVFNTPDFRRLVKRASNQASGGKLGHGAAVTDDDAFTPVAIHVMSNPSARARLRGFMRSHMQVRLPEQELASRTYHQLCHENDGAGTQKQPLPQEDVVCVDRGNNSWFLDPDRFGSWLKETPLEEAHLPVVAGYAACFAMLQPEIRRVLPGLLLEKDPRFAKLITDAAPETSPTS